MSPPRARTRQIRLLEAVEKRQVLSYDERIEAIEGSVDELEDGDFDRRIEDVEGTFNKAALALSAVVAIVVSVIGSVIASFMV